MYNPQQQHQHQQRPPTAPPTPENSDWPAANHPHYTSGQSNLAPPYMYDRSRGPINVGGPGLSPSYAFSIPGGVSSGGGGGVDTSHRNQGELPQRGHTPSSAQPSLQSLNPSSTSTAVNVPNTSLGPGPGPGAPLLLNNLAQHLNNPPAPAATQHSHSLSLSQNQLNLPFGSNPSGSTSPIPGNATTVGANGAVQGGKLLLLPNGVAPPPGSEEEKIYILITELLDTDTRETALLELSKKREMYEDLALVLWGGFGVMSSLLLEIVNVYPALSPPSLTAHASNRVCNALALLQCVASHSDTRSLFLNAHIPLFLYPFLNTTSKTRPFEYLRLTSLGVIGALVKQNENSDVINFLLSTEIIPLCLRIMETGSELSKTVAIFIVQKILLDDLGLQYICQTYERFYAVGTVLSNMVATLVDSQAVRLLKHVVRCYLRMSDNPRAREALRACLPEALRDATFAGLLKGDMVTKRCLMTLLQNLDRDT